MLDKRTHIMATARDLFATEGLAVPTAKIAKQAMVANGTLFNYFNTKQALIDAIYLEAKQELMQFFAASGIHTHTALKDVIGTAWSSYVRWSLDNPLKHRAMNLLKTSNALSPAVIAQTEGLMEPIAKLVQRGMKAGEIITIDLDYLYSLMTVQIEAAVSFAQLQKLKGKALDKHLTTGFNIFWNGIAP